ncbi:MAG: DUF4114 domain-containing protein [Marinobacterium sp.]|nr:DUF4114 domain-containing protein [Marinobacterium sp.]
MQLRNVYPGPLYHQGQFYHQGQLCYKGLTCHQGPYQARPCQPLRSSRLYRSLCRWLLPALLTTAFSAPVMAAATPQPQPISSITLNQDLLDSIDLALPESTQVDAAYLNPDYDPTVRLSQDAQLSVTFIDEGAGYRNSLGYFTFTDDAFDGLTFGDIDANSSGVVDYDELLALDGVTDSGLIFNNASTPNPRSAGDTLVLGGGTATQDPDGTLNLSNGTVFSAGTNMGFFLVQNGWSGNHVKGIGDNASPVMVYSTDLLNPENAASATLGNTADSARHTAMMFADNPGDGLIIGFEDLHRTDNTQNDFNYRSDNDFNDLVFVVNASPYTALSDTDVPTANDVINPAPVGALGGGSGAVTLLAAAFLLWRRRQH